MLKLLQYNIILVIALYYSVTSNDSRQGICII